MKETILWYHWSDKANEYKGIVKDLLTGLNESLSWINVFNFERLALEVNGNRVRVLDLDMEDYKTPWIKIRDSVDRLRVCTNRKKLLLSPFSPEDQEIVRTFMGMDPWKFWTKQSLVKAIAGSELVKEFNPIEMIDIETKILLTRIC
jgi:hypothetical protein